MNVDELLACIGLVCYELEEARQLSISQISLQRLYLIRSDTLLEWSSLKRKYYCFGSNISKCSSLESMSSLAAHIATTKKTGKERVACFRVSQFERRDPRSVGRWKCKRKCVYT